MLTLQNYIVATRVSSAVNNAVRKIARGLGVSRSEYLRNLILQDLDSKGFLRDEQLAKAVKQAEEDERTPKRSIIDGLFLSGEREEEDEDFC